MCPQKHRGAKFQRRATSRPLTISRRPRRGSVQLLMLCQNGDVTSRWKRAAVWMLVSLHACAATKNQRNTAIRCRARIHAGCCAVGHRVSQQARRVSSARTHVQSPALPYAIQLSAAPCTRLGCRQRLCTSSIGSRAGLLCCDAAGSGISCCSYGWWPRSQGKLPAW